MLKPYHEVRNGGSRHEKVMTNFTMNTDLCAPLYVQSSDKSCVTRYSLSFPYPFVFSQSQTTFIQWSALESLLHLRNRIKKKMVKCRLIFLCLLVPKTFIMYKTKRILTVYIYSLNSTWQCFTKTNISFLDFSELSFTSSPLINALLALFITFNSNSMLKNNRKYVNRKIFGRFQFL